MKIFWLFFVQLFFNKCAIIGCHEKRSHWNPLWSLKTIAAKACAYRYSTSHYLLVIIWLICSLVWMNSLHTCLNTQTNSFRAHTMWHRTRRKSMERTSIVFLRSEVFNQIGHGTSVYVTCTASFVLGIFILHCFHDRWLSSQFAKVKNPSTRLPKLKQKIKTNKQPFKSNDNFLMVIFHRAMKFAMLIILYEIYTSTIVEYNQWESNIGAFTLFTYIFSRACTCLRAIAYFPFSMK